MAYKDRKNTLNTDILEQLQSKQQEGVTDLAVIVTKNNLSILLGNNTVQTQKANNYDKRIYYIPTILIDNFNTLRIKSLLKNPSILHCLGDNDVDRVQLINEILSTLNDSKNTLEEYMLNRIILKALRDTKTLPYETRNKVIELSKDLRSHIPALKEIIDTIISHFLTTYKIQIDESFQLIKNPYKLLHHIGHSDDEIETIKSKRHGKNKDIREETKQELAILIGIFNKEIQSQSGESHSNFIITKRNHTNTLGTY